MYYIKPRIVYAQPPQLIVRRCNNNIHCSDPEGICIHTGLVDKHVTLEWTNVQSKYKEL